MPIWLRAIIFGIELVGFLVLCIFATIKFHKEACLRYNKNYIKESLKFNVIYLSINFAIILALFLFTFPSYVFLSYNKMILVTVWVILSVLIIMIALVNNEKVNGILVSIFIIMLLVTVAISGSLFLGLIDIENKSVVYSEKQKTETITTLTMFEENQIGYTADIEGNIKMYFFYYKDKDDQWCYKELNASEVEIERIQDGNSYFEETIEKIVSCKYEKKASEPDYITTVEDTDYKLYLNLNQKIEIKKFN